MIKKIALIIALQSLVISSAFSKELYKIEPNNSKISWQTSYLSVIKPKGEFSEIGGLIAIDAKNPKNSSIKIIIKTNSIKTGFTIFDKLLIGKGFFDAEKNPTISFTSSNIEVTNQDDVVIDGVLQLHGTKKDITIKGKIKQTGNLISAKIQGDHIVNFSSKIAIKRSDFHMDFAMSGISDNVEIYINIEASLISKDKTKL